MNSTVFIFVLGIALGASAPSAQNSQDGQASQRPTASLVLDLLKRVAYLGKFNNKEFFIVRDSTRQTDAALRCEAVGLQLGKVETQDELNFVQEHTSSADGIYIWTGITGSPSFTYTHSDGTEINGELVGLSDSSDDGLVISRSVTPVRLVHQSYTFCYYYLCTVTVV